VLNGSEDWVVRNDLPTDNPQGTHLVFYVQDENFPIKLYLPLYPTYNWLVSVQ
jgi:hypothetical protein